MQVFTRCYSVEFGTWESNYLTNNGHTRRVMRARNTCGLLINTVGAEYMHCRSRLVQRVLGDSCHSALLTTDPRQAASTRVSVGDGKRGERWREKLLPQFQPTGLDVMSSCAGGCSLQDFQDSAR